MQTRVPLYNLPSARLFNTQDGTPNLETLFLLLLTLQAMRLPYCALLHEARFVQSG